jgi:hypothetical protein
LAGLDSREDDELAEIELTYSILDDINQARPAFGRPAVCIIQVKGKGAFNGMVSQNVQQGPAGCAQTVHAFHANAKKSRWRCTCMVDIR